MKKIFLGITLTLLVISLSACGSSKKELHVLNWGEYMDDTLVERFEEEYDVVVKYDIVDSNEAMEVKIKAGTTSYDIAFPSDYMIDKLRQQGLLNEIDHSLLTGFGDVTMKPEVVELTNGKGYDSYFIPYFWGTLGIMYNTSTVNVEDLTGFDVLFDENTTYKIGMYDSARDASAAALMALGYDVNTSDQSELDDAKTYMGTGVYESFGTDNLKGLVQSGNLDMALVYSGDYFDLLYVAEEEDIEINFEYFVPETTNIWVDGFVIPTTSDDTDLAHQFINFFLNEEVSAQNADWVGYAPVLTEVYNLLVSNEYGYDYENYNPSPDGTTRLIYEFVSETRFQTLNDLLDAAKAE